MFSLTQEDELLSSRFSKRKDQQVYFHTKGNNGEVLTHSEGYTRKESAQDTVESINGRHRPRLRRRHDPWL
jgi:uncharacterized protein YegP (UPF0339 family)